MGGLILQGPCHGVACEIRTVWCFNVVCRKLRCDLYRCRLSCSLVSLTVLREICAPQTHPMGFVKSTHPTHGVRVTRTHPSRIPQETLQDKVQGTKRRNWKTVQPAFLIRKWVRFKVYNDSLITCFAVCLSLLFLLLIFCCSQYTTRDQKWPLRPMGGLAIF